MKPIHILPPALAIAVAGILVGAQRQKIFQLESESILLREHIAAEKSRDHLPETGSDSSRPVRPKAEADEIDWMEIAESFAEMKNGGAVKDMRKAMSFQRRLQKMDKAQLLAALDKIQALELDDEQRAMLESMIIAPLAQKDPGLVLNRFSDRIGDEQSGMSWQLSNALGEWAKKDQAAAIAWLDKEIATGTFDSKSLDGKSRIRLSFETNLVAKLISTDPAAAEARIAALPADQRQDALDGFGYQRLKDEDQAAYAAIVRSQLTKEEVGGVFGQQASMLAMQGDLEKVSGFLDRIAATGEERVKAAEKAATGNITGKAHQSKVTEEKMDTMRAWLGTQAPGSVDRVTGETLGQIANQNGTMKFPEAVGMVLKYHAQDGSDGILTGFLEKTHYSGNKEESRKIAEQISDPKLRDEALKKLE